ncbi:NAD(P)-dependent dehydrogenase (short-subunit alcohol dehydrogenase family) [Pullulanibacillus pueri]|uniref:Beta-ketoacyl-ACP reductase n=1 Tax=Pullulanibacillus pueri TaxID=1437324 RepID=A0A8J3ELF8_9BACL|nr:SDR family oxidoreductase [Pullulanibacillus pueri]MBM7681809.1 NAD(P)-dependent dehydrogenase (short-subunit alcohol dehydrogenase family) [Pullulanibacillus pueri]GGH76172.1 beta-ketoacyl-ACP reductase [Pullulanibacillus pueri]
MNLLGKVALVTGAGTGIGKGIAIELAKQGAKVGIHYHSSDAGAKDTQQRISELNGESFIVKANVMRKEEIDHMVKTVADYFGGIDILVNNAALQLNVELFDYEDEAYDHVMQTNLKGYWQCIQAVIPYMKEKGSGRIINISSVHGKRPTDFDPVYAMTKGGIKMLVRESAIELAKYGITVNEIEPGAVDVGKGKRSEPRDAEEKAKRNAELRWKFPLGRVGLPADIGHMAAYIASDQTEFMTGASVRLDGGSMLL